MPNDSSTWFKRAKIFHEKARTGCSTCERRHLKCGEEKPKCARCVKTNLNCTYESADASKPPPTNQPSNQFRRLIFYVSPDSKRFDNAREKRAFQCFQYNTSKIVGLGLGWISWGHMVLQSSEADATLRHAVVALGALHEKIAFPRSRKTPDMQQQSAVAHREYHKSIMQLREKLLTSQKKLLESTMLSCTLLTLFDFVHGDDQYAIAHLRGGISLLRTFLNDTPLLQSKSKVASIWRLDEPDPEEDFIPSSLEQQFYHPLIYAYAWMDSWSSAWLDIECSFPQVTILRGLQVQLSASEADGAGDVNRLCENLAALERRVRELLRTADAVIMQPEHCRDLSPYPSLKQALLLRREEWQCSCETLLSQELLDRLDRHRLSAATMNNHPIWISLKACQKTNNASHDYQPYTQNFSLILAMAIKALETAPTLDRPVETVPFLFADGIIHALYLTAVRCCDEAISAKAINVLESTQWREGAWDSSTMARIARRRLVAS